MPCGGMDKELSLGQAHLGRSPSAGGLEENSKRFPDMMLPFCQTAGHLMNWMKLGGVACPTPSGICQSGIAFCSFVPKPRELPSVLEPCTFSLCVSLPHPHHHPIAETRGALVSGHSSRLEQVMEKEFPLLMGAASSRSELS